MYRRFSLLSLCLVGLVFGSSCSKQSLPAGAPAPVPVTGQNPTASAPATTGQATPADQGQPANTNPPTATAAEQPSPEELLRQVADVYRKVDSFEVDYSQTTNIEAQGQKQEVVSEMAILVQRPNRLAMRNKAGSQGIDIVSDGEQLYTSIPQLGQYTKSSAPQTFDELLANPQYMMLGMAGGRGPLLELFTENPYEKIMEGVISTTYVGKEMIDGKAAHHLKFEQEIDWELWVAAEGEPLVRQMSIDMGKAMAQAGQAMPGFGNMKMTSIQIYKNWRFGTEPAANAFAFQPSPGAKEMPSLFGDAGPQAEEVSPLIGKLAPDIEQKLLDGSEFSLKGLRGKQVVMLDFWATWCGPCVQEMPILAKVAGDYRDDGVALFCVNQQEAAGEVRTFLDNKKLDVTVCLDIEGTAGQAYGANAIPMLVLIDKEGVVQRVHVGFSPNIEATLRSELDELLARKDDTNEAK